MPWNKSVKIRETVTCQMNRRNRNRELGAVGSKPRRENDGDSDTSETVGAVDSEPKRDDGGNMSDEH